MRLPAAVPSRAGTATPIVRQVEDADCGPTCLSILLAHHGIHVPSATVRAQCGASRDGSTAADLTRVGRLHGVEIRGIRLTGVAAGRDDSLAAVLSTVRRLPLPAIALLGDSHFVVLEAVRRGDRVELNDPARGRTALSGPDFVAAFSGVLLTATAATATATGLQGHTPRRHQGEWVRVCAGWLAPVRGPVVLSAGMALGVGCCAAGCLAVLQQVARARTDGRSGTAAAVPAAALLLTLLTLLAASLGYARRRLVTSSTARLAAGRSRELLDRLLLLPASFTDRRSAATLLVQVRFAGTAGTLLALKVAALVGAVAFLVPVVVLVGVVAPTLLVVAGVGGGAAWLLRRTGDRRTAAPSRLVAGDLARRSATARVALARGITLHADGSADDLRAELAEEGRRDVRTRRELAVGQGPWRAAAAAVEVVTLAAAGSQVVAGEAPTIGLILAVPLLLVHVREVSGLLGELPDFTARLEVLDDICGAEPEPQPGRGPGAPDDGRLRGRVELLGLTFGYSSRRTLVGPVSTRIEPGRRAVVVGPPGGGGSTLVRLLLGALRPTAGAVLLDGVPVHEVPRAVLRRSVGYVAQRPAFFPATVHDNVTMFDTSVRPEQVQATLREVGLADVVDRRGGALVARVAPGAANFSEGERRLLALARALVRDPSLLLLDEPVGTSDGALARRIDGLLRSRRVTTVLVTRRPDLIGPDDTALVLRDGRFVPSADRGPGWDGAPSTPSRALHGEPGGRPSIAVSEVPEVVGGDPVPGVAAGAAASWEGCRRRVAARGAVALAMTGVVGALVCALPVAAAETARTAGPAVLAVVAGAAIALTGLLRVRGSAVEAIEAALQQVVEPAIWARLLAPRARRWLLSAPDALVRTGSCISRLRSLTAPAALDAADGAAVLLIAVLALVATHQDAGLAGATVVVLLVGASVVVAARAPSVPDGADAAEALLRAVLGGLDEIHLGIAEEAVAARVTGPVCAGTAARGTSAAHSEALLGAFAASLFPALVTAVAAAVWWRSTPASGLLTGCLLLAPVLLVVARCDAVVRSVGIVGRGLVREARDVVASAAPPTAPAMAVSGPQARRVGGAPGTAVDLCGVSLRYATPGLAAPGLPAVAEVTLTVAPGEFVVLVGASGAGASSLLRLLAGLEEPDSGIVLHDGTPLTAPGVSSVRPSTALLVQDADVPRGTVRSVLLGHGGSAAPQDAVAWALLRAVGLEDEIRGLPMGLATVVPSGSGGFAAGQLRRLALARALRRGTRLLLLDQPVAPADPDIGRLATVLRDRRGTTRVVATAAPELAWAADRVVVLSGGRVAQEGRPDHLLRTGGPCGRLFPDDLCLTRPRFRQT